MYTFILKKVFFIYIFHGYTFNLISFYPFLNFNLCCAWFLFYIQNIIRKIKWILRKTYQCESFYCNIISSPLSTHTVSQASQKSICLSLINYALNYNFSVKNTFIIFLRFCVLKFRNDDDLYRVLSNRIRCLRLHISCSIKFFICLCRI